MPSPDVRRRSAGSRRPPRLRCVGVSAAAVAEVLESRALLSFGPVGPEFRVNENAAGSQQTWEGDEPAGLDVDADGDFVVTWSGQTPGNDFDIFARRFNAAGQPKGGEFLVNTTTTGTQGSPKVAVDADGDFVVVWDSLGGGQAGAANFDVFARRFNAAGEPQGDEFRVNTFVTGRQYEPVVAMDDAGDFVVVWASLDQVDNFDLFAQRFDAAGQRQGGEFQVNTVTGGEQRYATVAADADGDFVVAWEGPHRDGVNGGGRDVFAQRFSAAGQLLGGEIRVNTQGQLNQTRPSVAMDADGDFVVAFTEYASPVSVMARRYNAAGVAQGDDFVVSPGGGTDEFRPAAAMDADGDFVIAWGDGIGPLRPPGPGRDGSGYGVYARRYNAAGTAQGEDFRVNSVTTGEQELPAAAMDAGGDLVVAWVGAGGDDPDGVFAQRFDNTDDNGADTTPPRVAALYADSTAWTAAFRNALQAQGLGTAALGYRVPAGADQLKSLPWSNVDRVRVVFSEHVIVQQADLAVRGVNTPSYAFKSDTATNDASDGFTYDPATFTATWTLAANVLRDKLMLDLDADAPSGVADAAGNRLDGEWTNGADTFPSGDGTPGGDFRFRLDVLPGNIDGAGAVNLADFGRLRAAFGQQPLTATSIFADLTGDGAVNLADFGVLRQRFGNSLPAANPA